MSSLDAAKYWIVACRSPSHWTQSKKPQWYRTSRKPSYYRTSQQLSVSTSLALDFHIYRVKRPPNNHRTLAFHACSISVTGSIHHKNVNSLVLWDFRKTSLICRLQWIPLINALEKSLGLLLVAAGNRSTQDERVWWQGRSIRSRWGYSLCI